MNPARPWLTVSSATGTTSTLTRPPEPKLPPPPPLRSPLYDIFWGLHKADLHVPPQKICHTRAVTLGMGGKIMVVRSPRPASLTGCRWILRRSFANVCAWEGWVVVVPFCGAIRYSGENLVKIRWNSGEFWWISGEILAKRANKQETHNKS